MQKVLVLVWLIFFIACSPIPAHSQVSEQSLTKEFLLSAQMSRTTKIVLEKDMNFCSAENKNEANRNGSIDVSLNRDIALRDITVDAICLDAFQENYDGIVLAMETALVASTIDVNFEYENLLYSMIATHQTALPSDKAWAYHQLSKKNLELVDGSSYFGKNPSALAGEHSFIIQSFLTKQHLKSLR